MKIFTIAGPIAERVPELPSALARRNVISARAARHEKAERHCKMRTLLRRDWTTNASPQ